jgi:hypothetical protein
MKVRERTWLVIMGMIVREAGEKDLGVLAKLIIELGYPPSTGDMDWPA